MKTKSQLKSFGGSWCPQNVCEYRCTATTDILSHASTCTWDLGWASFATQLLDNFGDLVDACSTDRMTSGLQRNCGNWPADP